MDNVLCVPLNHLLFHRHPKNSLVYRNQLQVDFQVEGLALLLRLYSPLWLSSLPQQVHFDFGKNHCASCIGSVHGRLSALSLWVIIDILVNSADTLDLAVLQGASCH